MEEKKSETPELDDIIDAIPVFVKSLKENFGDGVQIEDAFALFQLILGPQVQAAVKGADKIADELEGLSREGERYLGHRGVDLVYDLRAIFSKEEDNIEVISA